MKKEVYHSDHIRQQSVVDDASSTINEELLNLYLTLPKRKREEKFADTARAAEIAGLSQRTIQLWIEIGSIKAIRIGKKYMVSLDSLMRYLRNQIDKLAS